MVFGYQFLCQPLNSLPGFKYAGMGLPPKYHGNASVLARDYEVVIFGAWVSAVWKASWGETLRDFARIEGRGLLLVGDYCKAKHNHKVRGFEALNSIAGSVERINDMNLQIASAAEEQSSVAEEINQNVVKIADIAQETSGSMQQIATSSEDLARLSTTLDQLVGSFKV